MAAPSLAEVLRLLFYVFLSYCEAFYRLFVTIPPKSLRGKIVLVTGASRGIGRELAYCFTKHGAKLVLWDINKEGNEETETEIANRGGFAKSYVCDVTNYDQVKQVAAQVRQDVGDVDILVNNAGVMHCNDVLRQPERKIRQTFELNIIAHFWTVKEFLPKMMENNSGHIVNISSMAGRVGTPLLTDYCASKFAVVGFTEALSEEMRREGKTGIHTTTVCPAFVNTNLVHGQDSSIAYNPGRDGFLEPEFVASEIVQGTMRNQMYVYIPKKYGSMKITSAIIPWKAQLLLRDFSQAGFWYSEK